MSQYHYILRVFDVFYSFIFIFNSNCFVVDCHDGTVGVNYNIMVQNNFC